MTEEEIELIKGCIDGDVHCQKQLYTTYGPLIKGICLRYAANEQEGEDLFHDTFIFILTHFKNFHSITSLDGWLRRIAVNKAIDWYRKKSRYFDNPIEDYEDAVSTFINVDETTLSMEQLSAFINELPIKYRTAFNLNVIDNIESQKVAEMMGETETNVRSLVSRSKKMLRKKIQKFLRHDNLEL